MKIMLAMNDSIASNRIKAELERQRYSVFIASGVPELETYLQSDTFDVLVLMDGFGQCNTLELLQRFRKVKITNPTLLVGIRNNPNDTIQALEAGADDFLCAGFTLSELSAHIKALLRRNADYLPTVLRFKNTTLDSGTYELTCDSMHVQLSRKEYQLMELFLRHPNKTFNSDELLSNVWGWDSVYDVDVVWTNIAKLRKKLKAVCSDVTIQSIRNTGYRLR